MSPDTPRIVHEIREFARLERVLATICALTPLVLIVFDSEPIRNSISAYYDMEQDQWYYFLLTVASMLFIVNGVIKEQNGYNTVLGVLLTGVILFNRDDHTAIHAVFAVGFFAGNVAVIAFFSRGDARVRVTLLAIVGVAVVAFFVFDWFTLFWLEWVSLAAIAVHYILDTLPGVDYRSAHRSEGALGM